MGFLEANMKPFDLKAALAGEPVILRDGRKAFITCDLRQYFKNPVSDKKLIGIISMINDSNSFDVSSRWYDSGSYYDPDSCEKTDYDIVGMWEEPKLTTEELMEKAFNERLVLKHPLLPEGCKGFKVVGKTVSGGYILQDCDNYKMYFSHTFNENIVWSVKE